MISINISEKSTTVRVVWDADLHDAEGQVVHWGPTFPLNWAPVLEALANVERKGFVDAAEWALADIDSHPQYPDQPLFYNLNGWSLNAYRHHYIFVTLQLAVGGTLVWCNREPDRAVVLTPSKLIILVWTPERVVPWTYDTTARDDARRLATWLQAAAIKCKLPHGSTRMVERYLAVY